MRGISSWLSSGLKAADEARPLHITRLKKQLTG